MTQWKQRWKRMEHKDFSKTLQALGLCAKARQLVMGTPMICEALKGKKKPFLVLCASDNSENTAKRLSDRALFYGVPMLRLEIDGEVLAAAVGKSGRVAAVAVCDENLCRLVKNTLKE